MLSGVLEEVEVGDTVDEARRGRLEEVRALSRKSWTAKLSEPATRHRPIGRWVAVPPAGLRGRRRRSTDGAARSL
jgi:hypothetical protein